MKQVSHEVFPDHFRGLCKLLIVLQINTRKTKVLGFGLDFTGKKCSDLNFVNRNVTVDEAAVVFVFETQLLYPWDLCHRIKIFRLKLS